MAQTQYTGKNALTYIFTIIKQYVTGQLATKANSTDLTTHTGNADIHVTTDDKAKWNAKQDALTAGSNITIQGNVISASGEILNSVAWDNITGDINNNTALKGALDAKANATDVTAHTGNADIHVTTENKEAWNAKLDASAIADMATKTELALKANSADVYSKTEIDDKGYQNATEVDALIVAKGYQTAENVETAITAKNYTTMTEVEGKGYQNASQVQTLIDNAVGDLTGVEFTVVESLPPTGEAGVIYLVAHAHGEGDGYDEYIWVASADTGSFEKIGNTDIDLSGYVLTTDLVEITNEEVQQLWDSVMA